MKVAQSCLTLCNPKDCSPPGSSVHGILQVRILQWVSIAPPRDLPDPGIKPRSLALEADSLLSVPPGKPYATGRGRKKNIELEKSRFKIKTKQKNKAFSCPVLRFSVHPLAFLCLSPTGNSVALTYQSLDSEAPGPSRWRNLGLLPAPSEPRGRPGASVAAESSLDSPRSPGPCRSPGLTL